MSGRVLVGPRFVEEALRDSASSGLTVVYVDARLLASMTKLTDAAARAGVPVESRGRGELDRLAGGVRHQGVVALAREYAYAELETLIEREAPLLVALDEITDPHNFGAIIRSAVAFGLDGIIVPRHRSASITAAVVRTSAGSVEHARIAQVTNLQRTLLSLDEEQGFEIIGLDAGGDVMVDALPEQTVGRVLVLGSEGAGLRRLVRERCHRIASIPQTGAVESLNASVAAAVAMYELTRAARARPRTE